MCQDLKSKENGLLEGILSLHLVHVHTVYFILIECIYFIIESMQKRRESDVSNSEIRWMPSI